jgi:hypothetical protein
MQDRKATHSEIRIWYKFKPSLRIWFSKREGKSGFTNMIGEAWYGGPWFNTGYFAFIQFKIFAIHIKLIWWKFTLVGEIS